MRSQKAFGLGLLMICSGLLMFPLMGTRTPRFDAFVLIVDTALATLCFVVALLLFGRYPARRSKALLVLASGFLFVALTTLPQLLRLSQGAFLDVPLRFITDLALPLVVITYVLVWRAERQPVPGTDRAAAPIGRFIAATVALSALAVWLVAAGDMGMVPLVGDTSASMREALATGFLVIVIGVAIGILWWHRQSQLHEWLLLMLTAWVIGVLVQGIAADGTSFAWHAARLYSLMGVGCVLLAVLAENAAATALPAAVRNGTREARAQGRGWAAGVTLNAVANELNQPLCAISANAEAIAKLLESPTPDLDEVRAAVTDISDDAHRASRAILVAQSLLGGTRDPAVEVDVAQLVHECLVQLRPQMQERRVICAVETAPHLPGVRSLRKPLAQLLVSLLTKSMESMSGVHPAERRLTVHAARHDPETIVISVQDSGAGTAFKVLLPASS